MNLKGMSQFDMFSTGSEADLLPSARVVMDEIDTMPVPVHSNPDATEVEAKQKVEPVVSGWRRQVLEAVEESTHSGLTGSELCAMWPERTQSSVRTRLTELHKMGLVVKSSTRLNDRGNRETVWVRAGLTL